ncbi:unnamed protein product [Adineta steineri]|uniref:Uncharacterized protein n=1 Tax=Adineta steineri TaxID=433720 RepID=A0A813PUG6_9BILA|nr:unnamed protein product [Adineta steineri]CAF0793160.1 unnamed protein product [Adineta steineri]
MKDNQSVVGCSRLVDKELIGGQHEAQLYLPKDSRSWKTIDSMHPCVEGSRLALSLPYRRSLIGTVIVQQTLAYVHNALPGYGAFTCTSDPAMQKAYERLGIVCVGEPFRYSKNDPLPVRIYWCSPQILTTAMDRALHKINQGN